MACRAGTPTAALHRGDPTRSCGLATQECARGGESSPSHHGPRRPTLSVAFRLLGVAALLLVAFVVSQSRSRRPLLPLSLVRDRNRAGAYLTMLLMAIGPLHVLRHHPAPPARLNVLGGGIDSIDPGATVLVPTLGSLAYDTLSRRPHAGQVVMPWRAAAFGETGAGWPSAPGGAHMWAGVMPHPTTGTGEGPWCVLRSRRDDGCSGWDE
jgi:hypothetical protein